ncbi:MAG: hypothetical protein K2N60_09090 [Oscillospiraceae bacterium]|nr:hypothetical protein [Oscillospiraceae bacterium]
MDINKIALLDIQPSQFYVSEEKILNIKKWFDPNDLSNFEPIPIKELDGRIIFTDGHTRAWTAFLSGVSHVPLVWDEDELDWEAYRICVDACIERGVCSVADFRGRVLSGTDYKIKWNGWCDKMHAELESKRKAAAT